MSYASNRKRSRSRGRGRRKSNSSTLAIAAMLGLSVSVTGGMGWFVYHDMQTLKPNEVGCYATAQPHDQTVVLVDASEPRFDAVQSRDLIAAMTDFYKAMLGFNENLKLLTTDTRSIGSIPQPVFEICGGATSSAELEAIGAAGASQAFLARTREQAFSETVEPVLKEVFASTLAPDARQEFESPILEQIQSISRMRELQDNGQKRRLIIVSDMIQQTRDMKACTVQGNLPSYARFKDTAYFQQIKPRSLSGVEITIYLIVRPGLGEGVYAYCGEDELVRFWTDFFADAGASAEVIRLRDADYVAPRD